MRFMAGEFNLTFDESQYSTIHYILVAWPYHVQERLRCVFRRASVANTSKDLHFASDVYIEHFHYGNSATF